jgi:hypothetical protein
VVGIHVCLGHARVLLGQILDTDDLGASSRNPCCTDESKLSPDHVAPSGDCVNHVAWLFLAFDGLKRGSSVQRGHATGTAFQGLAAAREA